jgi:16S rRNA (cytosine1402-N4)-methyltransferase
MSQIDENRLHTPVLLTETIDLLKPRKGEQAIDATLGIGGHTEMLLEAGARVLGIDRDSTAIIEAEKRLSRYGSLFQAETGRFSQIREIAAKAGFKQADIILADLGVSSIQFDIPERGFSFRFDAPLDMRMDQSKGITAAEILAEYSEQEIADIIFRYGEERYSRRIARQIVKRREEGKPVTTTKDLAELVERALPRRYGTSIHPATRTFQALRIAVNDETNELERFLEAAVEMLKPGGRIAVISFHSLEDRIVKQKFARMSGKCECPPRYPVCQCGASKILKLLTRKPVTASEDEISRNPRSRSAKLRAAQKIA